MPDFVGSYHQHFDVVRADTPTLLDLCYRLRYQVYCLENSFEDPARYPNKREIDDDDDRSVHTLLIYRATGAAAGTARLILPQPDAGRVLPIQRSLRSEETALFRVFPLLQIGEISRFAISKEFRRRHTDGRYGDTAFPYPPANLVSSERRLIPHITFGLMRGLLRICRDYQISILAAVMEPSLLRILARLGLDFERLGPLVEHHGRRQPCIARLVDLLRGSRAQGNLLWEYWQEDASPVVAQPRSAILEVSGMSEPEPVLSSAHGFP